MLKQIYQQMQRRISIKAGRLRAPSCSGDSREAKSTKCNQQNELLLLCCCSPVAPAGVESVLLRIACQLELRSLWVAAALRGNDPRSAQQMYFSDSFPAPSFARLTCLLRLPIRRQKAGKVVLLSSMLLINQRFRVQVARHPHSNCVFCLVFSFEPHF